jgi:hypothetical protein
MSRSSTRPNASWITTAGVFAASVLGAVGIKCAGTNGDSAAACEQSFDAYIAAQACSFPLPSSEVTRLRPRFLTDCEALLALPGIGVTASEIATCSAATLASPCIPPTLPTCAFTTPGRLGNGSSCIVGSQCTSTSCAIGASPDGRQPIAPSCGACAATIPTGGLCDGGGCTSDAVCTYDSDAGTSICSPFTYVGAGVYCADGMSICNPGLVCGQYSQVCTAPGGPGDRCAYAANECEAGLVCPAAECVQVFADASCGRNPQLPSAECDPGLYCDGSSFTCVPRLWAMPGESCDSAACLVGACDETSSTTSVCPAVVQDGDPCPTDSTATCDTFSICDGTVCRLANTVACR